MKILQIAPLWEDVPPKGYGGTELIVHILCEELIKRGHDVTLIATGNSQTSAKLESITKMNMRESKTTIPSFHENISIIKAIELAEKDSYDIIHNHSGLSALPFTKLIKSPVITTLHGAFVFDEEISEYQNYKYLPFISISDSQRIGCKNLNYVSTVYNGIWVENFEYQDTPVKDDPYLTFLGRISREKGVHLAIQLAKITGWKLKIAAKIDRNDLEYYESEVKHLIDGEQIQYLGEIGHKDKVNLLKNAHALIHAVTWPEPFGLTIIEAMACGTPVLALNQGSIPEVILHGVTGYIENNISDLIKRVDEIGKIERLTCRKHVERNFSANRMVNDYLKSYYKVIAAQKISVVSAKQEISSPKAQAYHPLQDTNN